MLIIDADDFHMKLKKKANSVDFKLISRVNKKNMGCELLSSSLTWELFY